MKRRVDIDAVTHKKVTDIAAKTDRTIIKTYKRLLESGIKALGLDTEEIDENKPKISEDQARTDKAMQELQQTLDAEEDNDCGINDWTMEA